MPCRVIHFVIPKVGRYWPERLYNQKRKLLGQIWALQPKVREAFEKLRTSSRFSADMFLKVRSHVPPRDFKHKGKTTCLYSGELHVKPEKYLSKNVILTFSWNVIIIFATLVPWNTRTKTL